MRVLFNSSLGTKHNFINQKYMSSYKSIQGNTGSKDYFIKSNNVAFSSAEKPQANNKNDILTNMAAVGVIGAPFVLSIAAATYLAKHQNPEDIFLPDGTYLMNTKDMTLNTNKIHADGDDGILKVKGTGININADKYDISDPAKGIYKNYDGSVDIDLMHNKYIDTDNGIFVDPENKISAIMNNGHIENIILPDFKNQINFSGSSMQGGNHIYKPTRSEYMAEHNGSTPEKDMSDLYNGSNRVSDGLSRVTDPDDNRKMIKKILDFINPLSPDGRCNHLYDRSKEYDVFGREILTVNNNGNVSKIALDEHLQEIANKYHLTGKSIGELSNFFEKIKLHNYLLETEPAANLAVEMPHESLNQFITRLSDTHHDVAEAITSDSVSEHIGNLHEHVHSFLDVIKEIYDGITN